MVKKNLNLGGVKSGKIKKPTQDEIIQAGLEVLQRKLLIVSDKERKQFDVVSVEFNKETGVIRVKVK